MTGWDFVIAIVGVIALFTIFGALAYSCSQGAC